MSFSHIHTGAGTNQVAPGPYDTMRSTRATGRPPCLGLLPVAL